MTWLIKKSIDKYDRDDFIFLKKDEDIVHADPSTNIPYDYFVVTETFKIDNPNIKIINKDMFLEWYKTYWSTLYFEHEVKQEDNLIYIETVKYLED